MLLKTYSPVQILKAVTPHYFHFLLPALHRRPPTDCQQWSKSLCLNVPKASQRAPKTDARTISAKAVHCDIELTGTFYLLQLEENKPAQSCG
jgi:hypothetical protein